MSNIIAKNGSSVQISPGVFAILDCNLNGLLTRKFVIVKRYCNQEDDTYSHICSCNLTDCFHIPAITELWNVESYGNLAEEQLEDEFQVKQIKELPSVYSVYSEINNTYGMVKATKSIFTCQLPCKRPRMCEHVDALKLHFHIPEEPPFEVNPASCQTMFSIVSMAKIQFPFQNTDRAKVVNGHISIVKLLPPYDQNTVCTHGFKFEEHQTKIINNKGTIHHDLNDITCEIHCRLSTGDCGCRQNYDGRHDHLINVDNIDIFPYSWLLRILFNIQEAQYTIWAAYNSANDLRLMSAGGQLIKRSIYQKLRTAYNGFIRLLDMDYKAMYSCQLCGPEVSILICDGIMIGTKQKLVQPHGAAPIPNEQIHGSTLQERMFGLSKEIKALLAKYTNRSRKGYSEHIETLSDEDFEAMCELLTTHPSLLTVVQEVGNPCKPSIRKLLGELSQESPTCGILQINSQDNEGVRHILQNIADQVVSPGDIDTDNLKELQKTCPTFFINFLLSSDISSASIAGLLKDLLISSAAPYQSIHANTYGQVWASHNNLEFFPNHLQVRGTGNYASDTPRDSLVTGCRKDMKRHKTLTPGFFTFFCQHSICVGFRMLRNSESPRTPFDIICRRFSSCMPKLIIYDSACKLHLYSMKREPALFLIPDLW